MVYEKQRLANLELLRLDKLYGNHNTVYQIDKRYKTHIECAHPIINRLFMFRTWKYAEHFKEHYEKKREYTLHLVVVHKLVVHYSKGVDKIHIYKIYNLFNLINYKRVEF